MPEPTTAAPAGRFPPRTLALYAAKCCLDKGAEGVRVLDLGDSASIYDFVVIASARSDRQTHACVDEVYHFCKRHGIPRQPVEGTAGWMLIDCLDVVVHVLTEEERARYDLDHLWTGAVDLAVEPEVARLPDPDRPLPAAEAAAPAKKRAKRTPRAVRKRAPAAADEA